MGKPIARALGPGGPGDSIHGSFHPHPTPHPVTGMWTVGSHNTFCNNNPVVICNPLLRSPSAPCAWPPTPLLNTMAAQTGSDKVFTNSVPTHRSDDLVEVCGIPSAPGDVKTLPNCSLNTYA